MITYEVNVEVEPYLADGFQRYMVLKHIPEILATGCFVTIAFERSTSHRFRTRYQATDQESLDRYLQDHTERFREDFLRHFPAGMTVRRETWESLERWNS
jgi:hypothetical protein